MINNDKIQILEGLCMHELLDKTHVYDENLHILQQKAADISSQSSDISAKNTSSHDSGKHISQMSKINQTITQMYTSHDTTIANISSDTAEMRDQPKTKTKSTQITYETNPLTEAVENTKTLDELAQIVQNTPHPFEQFSKRLVFGDGARTADVMVIGEAPGADEDEQQKPFVGQSGMLLMDIFKTIHLERSKNFYITNIIPWRPPFNQTPTLDEIKYFLPYIKKHIELIGPKMLVLIGATAYKALSLISNLDNSKTITQIHGQILDIEMQFNSDKKKMQVCVLLHPSYLLRLSSQKKNMWRDIIGLEKQLCVN